MINENDYIRAIKQQFPQLPPEREWDYRQQFRRMPNSWKREIDRERVKHKQSLNFSEWWAIVTENSRNGSILTKQRQEIKRDTKYDSIRAELNDNNFREYIGLEPLSDEELNKVKEQYEENVEGKYDYPENTLPNQDDNEEEISKKTLKMMDQSMENLEDAEAVDMGELQNLLEE